MTEPHQQPSASQQPPMPVLDPGLDAAGLAQLAQERPDLWLAIQQHPNCYPGLYDWIAQQSAPQAQGASMQQFQDGAKKAAASAKDFFDERVAPAARKAAKQAQSAYDEQSSRPGSALAVWTPRAPLILSAAAFAGMINLFLPMVSHSSRGTMNFFSDAGDGIGVLYLLFFLVTIAASVVALVVKARWARITAGAIGGLTGLFAAIDGFVNIVMYAGESRHSPNVGLFFLSLLGLALLAASVLIFLSLRGTKGQGAPVPPAPPVPPQS